MTNESKALEAQKEELLPELSERTRDCRCFVPRADIYETEAEVVILMDMPGIEDEYIEISLEKNILTVNGYLFPVDPEGYSLARCEYQAGDFERSFRISNQIEQDQIKAQYQNGVLRLTLPKAEEAKKRKIEVKVG